MTDFSLLQTPDYFTGGVNALQAGQQALQGRKRKNALAAYGADPQGARNALLSIGDTETVGQLQGIESNNQVMGLRTAQEARAVAGEARDVAQEGRAVSQEERTAKAASLQQQAQLNGVMLNGVRAIRQVPEAERSAVFARDFAPELERQGVSTETIQRLASAKMDDSTLQQYATLLGQEAQQIKYQFMNLGDGGVARGREDTGELVTLREPRPALFAMDPEKTYIDTTATGGTSPADFAAIDEIVLGAYPTSKVTSADRSEAENQAAGGVADSYHLSGRARDYRIPQGMTAESFAADLRRRLPASIQVIAEPAKNHVHIEPAPQSAGPRVIQQGQPRATYRAATPQEVATAGLPAGTPAQVSPEGKIEPFTVGASLKPIPSTAARTMADTQTAMDKIDAALEAVNAYPQGLGLMNRLGDTVRQRADPGGVNVRAAVADIGSQIIHDRSGANVTISESPRLLPFIPNVNDTPETVKTKLNRLREALATDLTNTRIEFGPDSGYRQLGGDGQPASGASSMSDAELKAALGL